MDSVYPYDQITLVLRGLTPLDAITISIIIKTLTQQIEIGTRTLLLFFILTKGQLWSIFLIQFEFLATWIYGSRNS